MTPSSMARSCQIGAPEVTNVTKYARSHLRTPSSECAYHVTSMEQHRILQKTWNSFIAVAAPDRSSTALTSTLQAVQEAQWNVPLLLDLNCLHTEILGFSCPGKWPQPTFKRCCSAANWCSRIAELSLMEDESILKLVLRQECGNMFPAAGVLLPMRHMYILNDNE